MTICGTVAMASTVTYGAPATVVTSVTGIFEWVCIAHCFVFVRDKKAKGYDSLSSGFLFHFHPTQPVHLPTSRPRAKRAVSLLFPPYGSDPPELLALNLDADSTPSGHGHSRRPLVGIGNESLIGDSDRIARRPQYRIVSSTIPHCFYVIISVFHRVISRQFFVEFFLA